MKNKQNEEKVHRFSELSKMLGRSRHSIWSRYQLLKKMQQDEDSKFLSKYCNLYNICNNNNNYYYYSNEINNKTNSIALYSSII